MEVVRQTFDGALVLHLVSVCAPLATLLVAAGLTGLRATLQLFLLGTGLTAATVYYETIGRTGAGARIEYGAPLPFARAPYEIETGQWLADPTILSVNLVGDLVLWCSLTIIVGTVLKLVVVRLLAEARRRPSVRRRPAMVMRQATLVAPSAAASASYPHNPGVWAPPRDMPRG